MSVEPASDVEVEMEVDEDESGDENATDNVGDPSVEINVEELISEIESESADSPDPGSDARRRLDELMEGKRMKKEISDYDDF